MPTPCLDTYSCPTLSPLYGKPPFGYRDACSMTLFFETNSEFLRNLVPQPLSFSNNAKMFLTISKYFAPGFGHYNEFMLCAVVNYKERPVNYCIYMALDNDIAITAGREIWGFPKKFGQVSISILSDVVIGTLERRGVTIAKAAMEIREEARPEDLEPGLEYVQLKLIPSIKQNAPPEVKQLTSITIENLDVNNLYTGNATLEFGKSPADRLHEIPVIKIIACFYYNYSLVLPYGNILHNYLKDS